MRFKPRRPPLRSVRAQTTVVAVTTVSIALVIGALSLVTILRVSLRNGLDRQAATQAQDAASLIHAGALPARLAFPGQASTIIQVVDANGVVIATSANFEGKPPVSDQPGSDPPYLFSLRAAPVKKIQSYRVAALSVVTNTGAVTVYAGESTGNVDETVAIISTLLLVGTLVLVAIVGVVTWRNARRALEPVHRIIAEVDAISEGAPQGHILLPGTNDEISELATTMNAMLDRLDRFTTRQRHFTADASHELRSPLASLRTQLEVALAHPVGVEVAVIGADLLKDVERLERLAKGLLDLARLDHGSVQHRQVDICEVVREVVAASATTRMTPCHVDLPAQPVMVSADRRQIERLLSNLLDNAERYAKLNIELRLRISGNRCALEVIDDGPGIGIDDRERIFERFTRLDDSRSADHGGAGLGLSIVKEIVRVHRGTIAVVPPIAGKGTHFSIELPTLPPSDDLA